MDLRLSQLGHAESTYGPGQWGARMLSSANVEKGCFEFSAALDELNQAARFLMAGASHGKQQLLDSVDFNGSGSQVELVTAGVSSAFRARVLISGYARVPLAMFERIRRAIRMLKHDEIHVRIESGAMKVESMEFSHPEIVLRWMGPRIADLAIGAPLVDVLAVAVRFRAEEIEDSGLLARVLEAQEELSRMVDQAYRILEPTGIERRALSEFVSGQIANRTCLVGNKLPTP